MLFPFPGAVAESPAKPDSLHFTTLVETGGGKEAGTLQFNDMLRMGPFGPMGLNPYRRRNPTNHSYVLAAHIAGKIEDGTDDESDDESNDDAAKDEEDGGDEKKHVEGKLNVIFVSDIDMIHARFFELRDQGMHPESGVGFSFDNVTFVLNALDYLAGDDRFVTLRKRRPIHRTLTRVDDEVKEARQETTEVHERLQKDLEELEEEEQEKLSKEMDKLRERMRKENLDDLEILRRIGIAQGRAEDRMNEKINRLKQEQNRERKRIERKQAARIRAVQDRYKFWAVALPPIPPLVVAVVVFFTRRVREREGVAKSRLR
jgi:ABC-2 type transport system permease protein